jgi:hypothetical protein
LIEAKATDQSVWFSDPGSIAWFLHHGAAAMTICALCCVIVFVASNHRSEREIEAIFRDEKPVVLSHEHNRAIHLQVSKLR